MGFCMSSKVSLAKLCRLICLNDGFQRLSQSFQMAFLVDKAKEAAEICSRCDKPEMVALTFGSKLGHSINDMTLTRMELEIAGIMKEMESDKLTEMFALIGEDEQVATEGVVTQAELAVILEDARVQSMAVLNGFTEQYSNQIETLKKELEIARAPKVDVVQPKVEEAIAAPEIVKEPTPSVGLVADLAIPAKQKAALVAAGLVTFEDVLKFHAAKTLESLKDIGDVAQGHILSLVGFKE